jgi:hypothetical protein
LPSQPGASGRRGSQRLHVRKRLTSAAAEQKAAMTREAPRPPVVGELVADADLDEAEVHELAEQLYGVR